MSGYFLPSVFEGKRDAPGWPTESDWPALVAHLEAHIASLSESDKRHPNGSLTHRAGGLFDLRQRVYRGDRYWSTAFQISELGRYQRGV